MGSPEAGSQNTRVWHFLTSWVVTSESRRRARPLPCCGVFVVTRGVVVRECVWTGFPQLCVVPVGTQVLERTRKFLPTRSMARYNIRQCGWLGGCLSVTSRYCIKTVKPIVKLVRSSGSPIIVVSSEPCDDTQFQGEPVQRWPHIHGGGKICDFR